MLCGFYHGVKSRFVSFFNQIVHRLVLKKRPSRLTVEIGRVVVKGKVSGGMWRMPS